MAFLHAPALQKFHRFPQKKTWAQCLIVKYSFREAVDKVPLMAPPPFEGIEEDENNHNITFFNDHLEGKGVLISLRSIYRMGVESRELPWAKVQFELETLPNRAFDRWCQKVLAILWGLQVAGEAINAISPIFQFRQLLNRENGSLLK